MKALIKIVICTLIMIAGYANAQSDVSIDLYFQEPIDLSSTEALVYDRFSLDADIGSRFIDLRGKIYSDENSGFFVNGVCEMSSETLVVCDLMAGRYTGKMSLSLTDMNGNFVLLFDGINFISNTLISTSPFEQ